MPFILLLVGLLGGALVSLLVISTTLAEGSFRITSLQQQDNALARQEQVLTQEVAQAQAPSVIAKEAENLGMRPGGRLQFIDLSTGKIVAGQASGAAAYMNVPGYTP
jgi:Na+-transporting NADH:ubiquinone oxidoreductase subunit NqrC